MSIVWVLLEILKIAVPALIVFLTVFTIMKKYVESQENLRRMEFRQTQQNTTIPLRLQAYERLSLFCERISIPSMVLRLRQEGMNARELRVTMMIAIQQEFEHNITQQVYISENLWKIVKIARDDVLNVINLVYQENDPEMDGRAFARELLTFVEQREGVPIDTALQAIKKEAGILL